jgi:riboflavin kinase/FMN adenylyltransferase
LLVEAHLLDFAGDLYGEEAKVAFQTRLHDDIAFESAAALVDQITRDIAATRLELGADA